MEDCKGTSNGFQPETIVLLGNAQSCAFSKFSHFVSYDSCLVAFILYLVKDVLSFDVSVLYENELNWINVCMDENVNEYILFISQYYLIIVILSKIMY